VYPPGVGPPETSIPAVAAIVDENVFSPAMAWAVVKSTKFLVIDPVPPDEMASGEPNVGGLVKAQWPVMDTGSSVAFR
jgi:hypothetical protein